MAAAAVGRKRGFLYRRVVQNAVLAQKMRMAAAVWRRPA